MMTIEYFIQSAHFGRFDALNLDYMTITNIAYSIFDFLKLDKFQIQKKKFNVFIDKIKEHYTETFYHNFRHAIDVVCSVIYLIKKLKKEFKPTKLETIGIVFGALLHDVGHYGKTGKFVSTYDIEKREKFGKISTLEKYHLNLGLKIIDESGIFLSANLSNVTKIKKIIKSVILSTNPSTKLSSISTIPIYKILIRCADISSVQKYFIIHKKWSDALMKEFYSEGHDLKTKCGVIEIEPLFDKSKKKFIPEQQNEFYVFYVEPHFNKLKPYLNNYNEVWNKIQVNKNLWQTKKCLLF